MKYTLFMDESGDNSLKNINSDFPIFVLLGVIINEGTYTRLCKEINDFKLKYFKSIEVVLRNRDIRKCEGPFKILFDLETKKNFYEDLNSIMTATNYMLVSSAILKQKHIEQYGKLADDPYQISLTFVMERALYEFDSRGTTGKVNLIIESRGKKEDQTLSKRYNELLYKGSNQVQPSRFLARYDQEIKFKKKMENDIGLQIADLCAYPVARHVLYPKEPYPAFEIVKPKIRQKGGKIDGYGLKMFP